MNIEISELVSSIPEGKKVGYLGASFFKAIAEYRLNNTGDEIDIDDLVSEEFPTLVERSDLIKDLKLFAEDKLAEVLKLESSSVKELDESELRLKIKRYYSIKSTTEEKPEVLVSTSTDTLHPLHDFQERIRRKVISLIFNGQKRFLIHMPTGSGKTRTASECVVDFIRLSSSHALLSEHIKILWIAQSEELCIQAYETVKVLVEQKATRDIKLGHFYGRHTVEQDIVGNPAVIFCSIQKLLKNYKKKFWQQIRNDNYLVVVDEAHRSVATQWVKALDFFVQNSSVYLLGLTATPGIGSSVDDRSYSLATYYQNNKITLSDEKYVELTKPIQFLVDRKYLAHINRIDIDADTELTDAVDRREGEFKFTDKTLLELSMSEARNASIVNIIRDNFSKERKMLVFTCGIIHNRILKTILKYHGIDSATIDASSQDRGEIIRRFKEGDLKVLLNFGVLTTGFDAPLTDICVIARPIKSIVEYSQMVGRILRGPKNGGNETNILYTIKDNLNHGDYDDLFNTFNDFYV